MNSNFLAHLLPSCSIYIFFSRQWIKQCLVILYLYSPIKYIEICGYNVTKMWKSWRDLNILRAHYTCEFILKGIISDNIWHQSIKSLKIISSGTKGEHVCASEIHLLHLVINLGFCQTMRFVQDIYNRLSRSIKYYKLLFPTATLDTKDTRLQLHTRGKSNDPVLFSWAA